MKEVVATQVTAELRMNPNLKLSTEQFHERALALAEQMAVQEECDEKVSDTTISSDAGEFLVTVDLLIYTDDHLDAIAHTMSFLRAALHALGASTPGWPDYEAITSALEGSNLHTERTLVPA